MKIIILLTLTLSSCVSLREYDDMADRVYMLEERIEQLEMWEAKQRGESKDYSKYYEQRSEY